MSGIDDVSARCDLTSQGDLDLTEGDLEQGPHENLLQTDDGHQPARSDRGSTETPEKEGCFSCCRSKMSRQQCLVFWLCGLAAFGVSTSVATMSPFFPQEAEKRGLAASTASMVFSTYSISALVTSPFMTKLVPYVGPKNVFLVGSALAGAGNLLFGSLVHVHGVHSFSAYCFLTRVLMGIGSTANLTVTYAYVSAMFPDRIPATLGFLEAFKAMGTCIGPAIGGLLFALGGYSLPFYSVGGFLLLLLPINTYAMPSIPAKSRSLVSYRALLSCFPVYAALGVVSMVTIIFSFTEAAMARHLHKRFDLEPQMIGLIFLTFAVSYGVTSPLIGWLTGVIKHRMPLMGGALMATSLFGLVFSPPQLLNFIPSDQLWLAVGSLCLAASFLAGALVPSFGVVRQMVKGPAGMADDISTDALVSSAFQTFYYLGYVIGPSLGGCLIDSMSFGNSLGIISAIVFFWGALTLITGSVLACRGTDTTAGVQQRGVKE